MNKQGYTFIVATAISFCCLISCGNDMQFNEKLLESSFTRSESCESDTSLRLRFESEEELWTVIASGINESNEPVAQASLPVTVRPDNFVSLISVIPGSSDGLTYYEALGYDSLVPNVNFAKLLNIEGEMEVRNDLVKITPKGTYIVAKDYEKEFRQWLSINGNHNVGPVGSRNSFGGGKIIFIRTFGENIGDYSSVSEGNYTDMPENDSDTNDSIEFFGQTRSSGTDPFYDDFAIFSADRKTIVGKLIQNIIGSTKSHTVKFNNKKRLKGSFYFYNYGVYSEIGVSGWTDYKRTFNWTKTTNDELRVGWRNVVLNVPMTDDLKNAISGKAFYISPQPVTIGKKTINAATLVDNNLPSTLWEKVAQKGAKAVVEFIKSRYDANKTKDIEKSEAFIIATPSELKFVANDEDVIKYNEKYYCHTFSEEFMNINIGWSNVDGFFVNNLNGSNIDNFGAIVKFIIDLFTQKHTTLVSGEVYICARFNNEWRGMKIIKN